MDCEPIPQKVWFEMWKVNRNRLRKQERDQLMQTLYEYRLKLLNVKRQLELSLLIRDINREDEAAKKKHEPKVRDFKISKYVDRDDYNVYKILNNLEEAVQNVLHKKGRDPPAPDPKGLWERKDIKLEDPMGLSIEDTEVKMLEVEKILSEINNELTALGKEGSEYEKRREELLYAKEDEAFLLEDVKGIHRFSYTNYEDRYETLLSCMMSLKAGTRVLRHCFCKEVITKRNKKLHLLGKVEPHEAEVILNREIARDTEQAISDPKEHLNVKLEELFERLDSNTVPGMSEMKDTELPILDPMVHLNVKLEESFERPEIKTIPGMSEMREKCSTVAEMQNRLDNLVKREELKVKERNARKELKRSMRKERRRKYEACEAPSTEASKESSSETKEPDRTLNKFQLLMLRSAQLMVQTDNFIDALRESETKLNLSHNVLLRCLNKAKAIADTERKYLSYLATC